MLGLVLAIALTGPLACRTERAYATIVFLTEYRKYVTPQRAAVRFVPYGSLRALTYVDPRTHRLTTMVNEESMETDCVETIQLMARHEACHVIHDEERLRQEREITPAERHRMEMRAGMCALLPETQPE